MRLLRMKLSRWKVGELYFLLYCLFFMTSIVVSGTLHESSECPSACVCDKFIGLVNCQDRNMREIPSGIPTWVTQLFLRNNRLSTHEITRFNFSIFQDLEELDLSGNKLVDFTVDFTGLSFLRKISLNHCSLSTLPNIKFESNLTQLMLSHNSITDISDNLDSFSSLTTLDLSFNKLRQIKNGTFVKQAQLKQLYLQKNRISTLTWSSFTGLTSLDTLDLSRNKIRNIVSVEPSSSKQDICFGNLQTLKTLNLSQNQLTHIDGLTFAGMCSLETLQLHHNKISRLSDGAFYGPTTLRTLILDHNDIKSITRGWLFKLEALQTLSVAYNNLSLIEPDGWKFCNELIHLNLSHNRLISLSSHGFSQLSNLETLQINNNKIAFLEDFAFDGLGKLTSLDLSNNVISSSIEDIDGSFLGLDSILYLSLRGNRILSLSASALEGVENVMTLDLRHNDITSIQNHTFDKMTNLRTLSIISSSFLCDCQLAWFPDWLKSIEGDMEDFEYSVDGSCFHPPALKGRNILNISMEEFVCVAHPIPILLQEPVSRTALIGDNITFECSASATYTDINNETADPTPSGRNFQTDDIGNLPTGETNPLKDSENPMTADGDSTDDMRNPLNPGPGDSDTTLIEPPLNPENPPVDSKKSGESRPRSGGFPLKADEPPEEPEKKKTPPQRRNAEKIDLDKNGMTVTWKRGQEIIHPGSGIEIRNITRQQGGYVYVTSLLVLKGVTSEDNGKYNCIISNNYGYARSKPVDLAVNEYPRFTKTPANVTVVMNGSSAILDCAATGQPSPQIHWQKDGGKNFHAAVERRLRREQTNLHKPMLTEDSESDSISSKGAGMFLKPGNSVRDSTDTNKNDKFAVDTDAPLDFAVVLPVDSGEYECVVESIVGRIVTKAMLIVEIPPWFTRTLPDEVDSQVGGSVVIQCLSEAKPDPEITWNFNGHPINLTDRHYLAAHGQMLIITGAEKSDAGGYMCRVSNKHGIISHETQLLIAGGDMDFFTALLNGDVPIWVLATVALVAILIGVLVTALICRVWYRRKQKDKALSTNTDETDLERAPLDGNSLVSTDESMRKGQSSQSIHLTEYDTNTARTQRVVNRYDVSPLSRGASSMSDITHMQILQSPSTQSTAPLCPNGFGVKPLAKRSQSHMAMRRDQTPIPRFRSAENFRIEESHPSNRITQSTRGRKRAPMSPNEPLTSPSAIFAKKAAGEDNYVPVFLKTQKPTGSNATAPSSGRTIAQTTPPKNQRTRGTSATQNGRTSTTKASPSGRTSSQKSKRSKKVKGQTHKEQNNTRGKTPMGNGKLPHTNNKGKMGVAGPHPNCEQNNTHHHIRQYNDFAKSQVHEPLDRRKYATGSVSSDSIPPHDGDVSALRRLEHAEPKPKISSSSSGPVDFSSDTTLASESSSLLRNNIPMVRNCPSPPSAREGDHLLT